MGADYDRFHHDFANACGKCDWCTFVQPRERKAISRRCLCDYCDFCYQGFAVFRLKGLICSLMKFNLPMRPRLTGMGQGFSVWGGSQVWATLCAHVRLPSLGGDMMMCDPCWIWRNRFMFCSSAQGMKFPIFPQICATRWNMLDWVSRL